MRALAVVSACVAAFVLSNAARAGDLGAINLTVEHAWSGVAPCLSKTAYTEDSIAQRLLQLSHGAELVNARVIGIDFVSQPAPLVTAFRQITRLAPRSGEGVADRVPAGCHDVLCASRAIFGDEAGPRLLLIAAAYRFNASNLGELTSQSWSVEDLDRMIAAFDDMPKGFFPLTGGEFRALVHRDNESWWTPAPMQAFEVIARAGDREPGIMIEDGWAQASDTERRVVLIHELAHEFTRTQSRGWRTTWQQAVEADAEAAGGTSRPSVASVYAERNLDEDFAESVAAYRYIAPLLKTRAPHRYALLKDWVFKGAEYGSAKACLGR